MSCSKVQNEYNNAVVGQNYSITFEYEDKMEVHVAEWNPSKLQFDPVERDTWNFQNETTIRFTTAPNPGPFIIYRKTDLEEMEVTFYPGSSIRAQDLNINFEQLQHALQELGCFKEEFYDYLDNYIWDVRDAYTKADQQLKLDGQKTSTAVPTDDKLFTSGAAAARFDTYLSDFRPDWPNYEQGGKRWYDTQEIQNYIWDDDNEAWIDYSRMGPQGPRGRDGHHIVIMGENAPKKRPNGDPICSGDIWLNTCSFDAFIYYCKPITDSDGKQCDECGQCVDDPDNPPDTCQWITLGSSGPRGPKGDAGEDGAQIYVGDNPPNPSPGIYEFWFDSTCGDLYTWYDNSWIQLNRPGKAGKDGYTKTIVSTIAPTKREDGSDLQNGDLWYDSCSGTTFLWYIEESGNSKWVELSGTGAKGDPGRDGLDGHRVWCGDRPPIAVDRYPLWFNTDCPNTGLYFWCDGKWIATMMPGPRGPKGENGTGLDDLNFVCPLQRVDDDVIFNWGCMPELPDENAVRIGAVTVTGPIEPVLATTVTYAASHAGNAGDVVFTFSTDDPAAVVSGDQITFNTQGSWMVTATATSVTADDSPRDGTLRIVTDPPGIPDDTPDSGTSATRWCVAVIDEDSKSFESNATEWDNFRANWPNRYHFVLEASREIRDSTCEVINLTSAVRTTVNGQDACLRVPDNYKADLSEPYANWMPIKRVGTSRSTEKCVEDWYEMIGAARLPDGARICLFVDNSGSMETATVQHSYDLFVSKLAARGIDFFVVENADENWIETFDREF